MSSENRKSVVHTSGPLIHDPAQIASIEARNALLQFDEARRQIALRIGNLSLTPQDICDLQKLAVKDIFSCAGTFRTGPIQISNSPHAPPSHDAVPGLVAEMCQYANAHQQDAIHCSSYLMWRHNWIHPFADGNGRTSRIVSYIAMCCGIGFELPGTVTIPELIQRSKTPYYNALDAADLAWKQGRLDVSAMERLLANLLSQQLMSINPSPSTDFLPPP